VSAAARGVALLASLASLATSLAIVAAPRNASAQEWRASARLGRVTYEGAPAGAAAGSSAVVGIGRTAPRNSFGLSAAIPLSDDPFWAVLGGWQRVATRGTSGPLLDLSANGFIQR
jgi:hypothetical protein